MALDKQTVQLFNNNDNNNNNNNDNNHDKNNNDNNNKQNNDNDNNTKRCHVQWWLVSPRIFQEQAATTTPFM